MLCDDHKAQLVGRTALEVRAPILCGGQMRGVASRSTAKDCGLHGAPAPVAGWRSGAVLSNLPLRFGRVARVPRRPTWRRSVFAKATGPCCLPGCRAGVYRVRSLYELVELYGTPLAQEGMTLLHDLRSRLSDRDSPRAGEMDRPALPDPGRST